MVPCLLDVQLGSSLVADPDVQSGHIAVVDALKVVVKVEEGGSNADAVGVE